MKRATLRDVAEATGVSVQTASHILNTGYGKSYRPETRTKVVAAAKRLAYRPNAAARSIVTQRSHMVGIMVPIQRASWMFPLHIYEAMLGINRSLMAHGYVTSIIPFEDVSTPEQESRVFREQALDGVVVMGWTPEVGMEHMETIANACIWCDSNVNRPLGCLRRDEVYAGKLVAKALIARGYRRLVWVAYAPPSLHYSHADRLAGLQSVARARGVPVEIVGWGEPMPAAAGRKLAGLLNRETAVVAEHLIFANLVERLAWRHRLMPGHDFGLATCDCSCEQARLWPDLSAVVLDRTQFGVKAAELLLKMIGRHGTPPASVSMRGIWQPGATAPGPR